MPDATEANRYNYIDAIIAYEEGELDDDEVFELFQYLLNTGIIYQLQGAYQRTAQVYLYNGSITVPTAA